MIIPHCTSTMPNGGKYCVNKIDLSCRRCGVVYDESLQPFVCGNLKWKEVNKTKCLKCKDRFICWTS
jgi:hypothetical protein